MACPASVRLSAEVLGYSDSSYAREGTAAHERAEFVAAHTLGLTSAAEYADALAAWEVRWDTELSVEQFDEIKGHALNYAALLLHKRNEVPGTVVFLEERVYPGVPQCFGTADATLVSPVHVEAVDFKYGAGIRVEVSSNPQLKLYGLGTLEAYDGVVADLERVVTTIYQPRVHSEPKSQEYTAAELREWRDHKVLPLAEEALSDDAHFDPGEVQCRWCPAAGICRSRAQAATEQDFSSDPDVLTDEELAEIMHQLPEIKAWAKAVEDVVFRKLYELRQQVPGWKVVKTEGNRKITDNQAAIDRLVEAGFTREKVARVQPETLGNLEKLVGKLRLTEVLGDLLKKGEGSKALVPEDDPRPPIDSLAAAKADFKEEA